MRPILTTSAAWLAVVLVLAGLTVAAAAIAAVLLFVAFRPQPCAMGHRLRSLGYLDGGLVFEAPRCIDCGRLTDDPTPEWAR